MSSLRVACPLLSFVLVALTACAPRGVDGREAVSAPIVPSRPEPGDGGTRGLTGIDSTSASALRCRQLPADYKRQRLPEDCPSPVNSDHTLKRHGAAPPSEPGSTVLFRYEDFGPPSLQLGLLGNEWWSWEAGGSWEICDEFDIRVVVHRGPPSEATLARFATVRGKSDYRFVDREAAVRYIDAKVAELAPTSNDPDEYDFGPLRRMLEQTRRTIVECLP